MESNMALEHTFTREDFMAFLSRGRQIKERRLREARQKWERRQQEKEIAAKSGYYDLEWV